MLRTSVLALIALAVQVACPAEAFTQSPGGSTLNGIYLGLRQNLVTGRVFQDYVTFYPDGRVLWESPTDGLDAPFDQDRCRYGKCGTYRLQGNQVQIRWDAGDGRILEIEAGGVLRVPGRE